MALRSRIPFSNFERIISGVPHRITTDERSELSRIARSVAADEI